MTYLQILNIIKDTAAAQPNINSVVREFVDLNREDARYSAIVIQDRDGERDRIYEQDYITYTWHLGYVDRLTDDESNRDHIFSTGINVINNIINSIRSTFFPELEVSVIDRFTTFNQRFTANCAGVYIVLAINVQVSDCVDSEQMDMYDEYKTKITENGHYHFIPDGRPVDEIDITVDVPGPKEEQSLYEEVTWNGDFEWHPDPGKVFKDVEVIVDVHPSERFEAAIYENGNILNLEDWAGVELTVDVHPSVSLSETYTSNGSYNISGEFNGGVVTVAVPSDQKPEESLERTITSNGSYHYDPEEGRVFGDADITVDVHPSTSLVETITSNGSYSYPGEYAGAEITVAVPVKTETSLVEAITSNGSYHYDPSAGSVFNGVDITVDVHPSVSLSETYTSNGSYNISGEFDGGVVTVAVPTTITVTMTQAQYDALVVKDSNTIYLING